MKIVLLIYIIIGIIIVICAKKRNNEPFGLLYFLVIFIWPISMYFYLKYLYEEKRGRTIYDHRRNR
jgi:hypothetical protein